MALKFTPPDYLLVFVALEIIMHYIFPIKQIIFVPYNYLGILLIVLGAYLNFVFVAIAFKKAKTTINPYEKPSRLVTHGAFRITRNPTYLGMALILAGIAVLLGSIIAFAFPVIFVILTNIFIIPHEEKNLENAFGKRYLEYKKKARRWI
ncbi:isoprenylcysteine carboxylmethyltransferase family protein [Candidatus Pacearchaeota archaeon]|nr:isoprenylcysteine carboxylmethyltransferase family protein [Candidatus Pacearchaeota archaeon]